MCDVKRREEGVCVCVAGCVAGCVWRGVCVWGVGTKVG